MQKKFMVLVVCLSMLLGASKLLADVDDLIKESDYKTWAGEMSQGGKWVKHPGTPGGMSLHLESETGAPYWTRNLPQLAKGRHYALKILVMAAVGTQYRIYLECTDRNAAWETVGAKWRPGSGTWVSVDFDFVFKERPGVPYIVLQIKAPGKADFAFLTIAEIPSSIVCPELIGGTQKLRWQLKGGKSENGDWVADPDCPGEQILHIVGNDKTVMWLCPNVPVAFNQVYEVSLQAKGTGEYRFFLESVSKSDGETFGVDWQEGVAEWKTYGFVCKFERVKVPPPYIVLAMRGAGQAWFRKLEILPLPKTIEMGASHWATGEGSTIGAEAGTAGKAVLKMACSESGKTIKVKHDRFILEPFKRYAITCDVAGEPGKGDGAGAHWFRFYPVWGVAVPDKLLAWQDTLASNQSKRVEFTVPGGVKGAELAVELRGPGMIRLRDFKLDQVEEPARLAIELDLPIGYRDIVASGNQARLTGEVVCQDPAAKTLELACRDRKGNMVHQSQFPVKPEGSRFEFPAPPDGEKFTLKLSMLDAGGKLRRSVERTVERRPLGENEISFDAQGMATVDGRKFFPIGYWGSLSLGSFADEFRFMKEAGFNTLGWAADSYLLDVAAKAGLKVIRFGSAPHGADLQEKLRQAKIDLCEIHRHPALLAYGVYDEPLWRGLQREELESTYAAIRQADPSHPIFINEAPRNEIPALRDYAGNTCDLYGVDIYPVPEGNSHSALEDKGLSAVGAYTERCLDVVGYRKPVWMTLQGFAWNRITAPKTPLEEGGYPTWAQSRFMAYDAIAHGANGILFWGLTSGHTDQFWSDLRKVTRELSYLSPVLLSATVNPAALKVDKPNFNILHKRHEGADYFIVVNRGKEAAKANFTGLGEGVEKLNVLLEDQVISVVKGGFAASFPARGVKVLSTQGFASPETIYSPGTYVPYHAAAKLEPEVELISGGSWIWFPGKHLAARHKSYFRRLMSFDQVPRQAQLVLACDDSFHVWLNGTELGHGAGWNSLCRFDLEGKLKAGNNVLAVLGEDGGFAPCGLLAAIQFEDADGRRQVVHSDQRWLVSETEAPGWQTNSDAQATGIWKNAEEVAKFNVQPWIGRFMVKNACPRGPEANNQQGGGL